jgi:hypothetical protein
MPARVKTGYIRTGLPRLLWSAPMKIMPLFVLVGIFALPGQLRAQPAVDCGSFPDSQMRLTCWNDTSRALQAYNSGQMPPDNVAGAPVKPKAARASTRKPVRTN